MSGHEAQPQGDQTAGVFELPFASGPDSPLLLESLMVPPTPEARMATLQSVNSCSSISEFGEQGRQAFAELIGGGKIDRFDNNQLNVPCVSTLLKDDSSKSHDAMKRMAAQGADDFIFNPTRKVA